MLNTEYREYDCCGMPLKQYSFSHNGIKYIVERSLGFYTGETFNLRAGIPFAKNSDSLVYERIVDENVAKELYKMFSDPNYSEEQIELWFELNVNLE